jgi:ribonuclease VapC
VNDIAVDTSAIVELMVDGPLADAIDQALRSASMAFVTSVSRMETAMVMLGRFGWDRVSFDRDWQKLALQEVPVDSALSGLAIDAFERWGRGRDKAALNFGDCFSYALAPRATFRCSSWATTSRRPTWNAPSSCPG